MMKGVLLERALHQYHRSGARRWLPSPGDAIVEWVGEVLRGRAADALPLSGLGF